MMAHQIDDEGGANPVVDPFVRQQVMDVEQVARMLTVEPRHHLSGEQVRERHHPNGGKAELLFDRIRDRLLLRLEHAAAQHRRDLDLDLRSAFTNEELVDRAFLSQHSGLNASDRKGGLDTLTDATQRSLDVRKRLCSVRDRQIGEVDVDRQPRKVSDEQVDRRPTLQREAFLLRDVRQSADQQLDLSPVSLIHRHRGPPEP